MTEGSFGFGGRLYFKILRVFFLLFGFIYFLLIVAILELFNEVEDSLNLFFLFFFGVFGHVAFHWFEFSELKNEGGEVCIVTQVPLSSLMSSLSSI